MDTEIIKRQELLRVIREQYVLDWHGIHGHGHWIRVYETGLILAKENGADIEILELFSFLHDSCRLDDGIDPEHGSRAVSFMEELHGTYFNLNDKDFGLLLTAIRDHTMGYVHYDPTVQVCWDADRLDLPRVGIRPDPAYFGTQTARKTLDKVLKQDRL